MKYDWSQEKLETTVTEVYCWWDWLRALNIPVRGCNYRTLKAKALKYNIDTSHFNSLYSRTHNGQRIVKNRSDEQIFGLDLPIKNTSVKTAYIERFLNGQEYCECCGIKDWNNKKITFQLHHKDGNPKNNTLDNICLLCPNCHSQTENFINNSR